MIGSSTMFTTAPMICETVENMDRPVACSSFSNSAKNTAPNEITQQMVR